MSKEIEDLLKCSICKNNYDLNSHYPMIIKCGHTFCKECITSNENKENNNLCPIDNQQTIIKIESSINNLLIEEIIKKVFNYDDKIQMKQIIYIKPDIRRNRSPSLKRGNNRLEEHNNENNENIDKSNNENNYNINTIKSTKIRSSTGYKKNLRFSKKEPNRFSNVNMKKIEIEDDDEKIKDDMNDSIETIPLNEDKSILNISFKDEWTAFLEKNIIEKKISKDEKEFLNNNEDTIDKISKVDDDFLTSSIANLIPALSSINNNNNKNTNNNNNNCNINNNNKTNNHLNNILNKNNRHINNNNALKMAAIENIKKMSKNINIDANILKYASSTYNSKNKIALFNKANIERKTNNNSKEKNNPIITKDISKTPTKEILNEDKEDENKNVLLQTYNKLSNKPYHKTVITNKHIQNKGNSSKNDDSRKETDESNKNNKSLGYELENKIKNKIIDDEQIKLDNNYNINIIDENKKEIKINEIPIEMNKRNLEVKNQNVNKSFTEHEENKYIKITKKENSNEILIKRKNSDITSEIKLNSIEKDKKEKENIEKENIEKENIEKDYIEKEKTEKPKEKNSPSKNQNSKNNEIENKKSPRTNIALQNFDFDNDTSNILENSIIIMKTKNENTFPKLKKELISILTLQNNTLTQKEIENSPKYKKYLNYIEKSLSNQKLKENPQSIKIKLFPNNDFFIGYIDYTNDEIKNGILYYNNGDYYEGEFQNGKKEGFGIIIYKNGTRYEGIFKNNKHNGYGKLIQLDGEVFIGDWKDGKINGKGVRYHSNGDRYIGSYINNIRNGEGHYIFSNGDAYEGNWNNGKANGKGKFTFKNGNIYEGDFKDNIICGKGKFTMNNGDVYIGVFKNGMINGKGSYKNSKGEKYVGFFLNGKKHGMGKLVDKDNNEIANGYWNMDNFVGKKNINEYM